MYSNGQRSFGYRFLALIVTLVSLAGCAGTASTSTPGASATMPVLDAASIKERASKRSSERWKALIDKRFEDSFAYLSEPSRAGITAAEYGAAMRKLGVLAATVEDVQCQDQLCTVHTRISLPIAVKGVGRRLQTLPVEEQWIVSNGELWLIRK